MKKNDSSPTQNPLRTAMINAYRMDETECVNNLLTTLALTPDTEKKIARCAEKLIETVRSEEEKRTGVDALMAHYDLSTEEGILLMCLAEALLRVPDKETKKLLIRDKLTSASWDKHIGASESSFVNMATWGLALSGKILKQKEKAYFKSVWSGLLQRSGEPVIRRAVHEAMKVLSENFVLGRSINEALKRSAAAMEKGYRYSYDMLGEVARTQKDADTYYQSYYDAILTLGEASTHQDVIDGPSISVKLSALHPRYEYQQYDNVAPALTERVKTLALHAKKNNLGFTVDAEESELLNMSLDIFSSVFCDPLFKGWEGLGLAVQAYQKRAMPLITWLIELARQQGRRIPVRLVKGAYWDSELKTSQMEGLSGYPVFTRKANTDISYLACAQQLLAAQDAIYPQFATHNAYSVAAILTMIGEKKSGTYFEFQSLQGMGNTLHDQIVSKDKLNIPCRIYAPIGSHEDLLPYLVRRLLENGANSSFVNRISDKNTPVEELIVSPIAHIQSCLHIPHPKIPLPKDIFSDRTNSMGIDLSHSSELEALKKGMEKVATKIWHAAPFNRPLKKGSAVFDPTDHRRQVGITENASAEELDTAIESAAAAYSQWHQRPVQERANIIRKVSELLETHYAELMQLAVREAGKTLPNGIAEVREAVDFCRYYACIAEQHLTDKVMPGYTGESNVLRMRGRGVMLCISPWNFPIAIFTGQVAAALVSGNAVISKPANQTVLTAAFIVDLFHQAGVPKDALQFVPARGSVVGTAIEKNQKISGVLFTGSNETANQIQQSLANRPGGIVPFIAETGGINAMIVDSTALPEQLVHDVIFSAFDSAGQRCSALRLLYVQDDIADHVIEMLAGAMAEIKIGDPVFLSTDVGPVIDADAQAMLTKHQNLMQEKAQLIYKVELPTDTQHGTYIAPQAYELPDLSLLTQEVFGPILHVVRYPRKEMDRVINDINGLGYGLTFGIQSRITNTVDYIQRRIQAGNIYVNRNTIGAVVGVQPFGGQGLSGTGPKAGGPHYLTRLCHESTLTIDTTAAGGNASLMAIED